MPLPLLLEEIEQEIIRRTQFGVQLSGTSNSLKIDCNLENRGMFSLFVVRRDNEWVMTDAAATCRTTGKWWGLHPSTVQEIVNRNGVLDDAGEIITPLEQDGVLRAMCEMLCAMLELLGAARRAKDMLPQPKGERS